MNTGRWDFLYRDLTVRNTYVKLVPLIQIACLSLKCLVIDLIYDKKSPTSSSWTSSSPSQLALYFIQVVQSHPLTLSWWVTESHWFWAALILRQSQSLNQVKFYEYVRCEPLEEDRGLSLNCSIFDLLSHVGFWACLLRKWPQPEKKGQHLAFKIIQRRRNSEITICDFFFSSSWSSDDVYCKILLGW